MPVGGRARCSLGLPHWPHEVSRKWLEQRHVLHCQLLGVVLAMTRAGVSAFFWYAVGANDFSRAGSWTAGVDGGWAGATSCATLYRWAWQISHTSALVSFTA